MYFLKSEFSPNHRRQGWNLLTSPGLGCYSFPDLERKMTSQLEGWRFHRFRVLFLSLHLENVGSHRSINLMGRGSKHPPFLGGAQRLPGRYSRDSMEAGNVWPKVNPEEWKPVDDSCSNDNLRIFQNFGYGWRILSSHVIKSDRNTRRVTCNEVGGTNTTSKISHCGLTNPTYLIDTKEVFKQFFVLRRFLQELCIL